MCKGFNVYSHQVDLRVFSPLEKFLFGSFCKDTDMFLCHIVWKQSLHDKNMNKPKKFVEASRHRSEALGL